MEENNINHDLDCSQGSKSDLGLYCLQYRLPKDISRREEQITKVLNSTKAK